jgi:hypothetical protein
MRGNATTAKWLDGVFSTSDDISESFIRYDDSLTTNALYRVDVTGQLVLKLAASIRDANGNAAAALAGVPLGGIYYDSTASNVLKVRTA